MKLHWHISQSIPTHTIWFYPWLFPQLLLVFSPPSLTATELRPAGVSPFSLQINCVFVITNRSNPHTDRRIPTKWKDPHTVTLWEEFCRDACGSAVLAPAALTAAPFLPLGVEHPTQDRLPGHCVQAQPCTQPVTLYTAVKCSPIHCYKMQLLLFWHFTQLSAPKFPVSNPGCFVLPSFPGQHYLQYRVPCLAHHLPIQDHCDDLHKSHTDPLLTMVLSSGAWHLQCLLFSRNHRVVTNCRVRTASRSRGCGNQSVVGTSIHFKVWC